MNSYRYIFGALNLLLISAQIKFPILNREYLPFIFICSRSSAPLLLISIYSSARSPKYSLAYASNSSYVEANDSTGNSSTVCPIMRSMSFRLLLISKLLGKSGINLSSTTVPKPYFRVLSACFRITLASRARASSIVLTPRSARNSSPSFSAVSNLFPIRLGGRTPPLLWQIAFWKSPLLSGDTTCARVLPPPAD